MVALDAVDKAARPGQAVARAVVGVVHPTWPVEAVVGAVRLGEMVEEAAAVRLPALGEAGVAEAVATVLHPGEAMERAAIVPRPDLAVEAVVVVVRRT